MQEIGFGSIYLPLKDHIEKYHDGSQASFARATGKDRSDVWRWLKSNNTIVFCTGHVHHLKVSAVDQTMIDLALQNRQLESQEGAI